MLINVFCPVLLDIRYTFPWIPSNLTVYVGDSVKVSLFVCVSFEDIILCNMNTMYVRMVCSAMYS